MIMRVTALAMMMGAGLPAMAQDCGSGQNCLAATPVAVTATNAPLAAKAKPPASNTASTAGNGGEFALLTGLAVLLLATRRRRIVQEVVS